MERSNNTTGAAQVPVVALEKVAAVKTPQPGVYYHLPDGSIGLCYDVGQVSRFARAIGQPDVVLYASDPKPIVELKIRVRDDDMH